MTDPLRLKELEERAEAMARELAELRRELGAMRATEARSQRDSAERASTPPPRAGEAPPPPPAPPPPRSEPRRPAQPADTEPDFEKVVGKYGALALAVLTIVMGAGALVSWAIRRGLLTPAVRVALGAVLALVIGVIGLRLRRRGERRYGNWLLALSLAVTHVVAWGAGPNLHLIPTPISLLIADAASIGIAWLALRDEEELLFAIGFGGALIAPFVMSTGEPHYVALAIYGLILIGAGMRTIGHRAWAGASWLLFGGTVLYTVAVANFHSDQAWLTRDIAPGFAMIVGLMALAWEQGASRPWLALGALLTMAMALGAAGPHVPADAAIGGLLAAVDVKLLALAGTALVFTSAHEIEDEKLFIIWAGATAVVPLLLLGAAVGSVGPHANLARGALVLIWALLYFVIGRVEKGLRQGVLTAECGILVTVAVTMQHDLAPDAVAPVLAALACAFSLEARRQKQLVVMVAPVAMLMVAFGLAAERLSALGLYTVPPFITLPSLGMASTVLGAWYCARTGLPAMVDTGGTPMSSRKIGGVATGALAFLWGHLELRRAISSDASTFLLITYYAGCGVAAIRAGHKIGESALRQLGLALAVFAALYALSEALSIQQIALRVGSYLAVGGFLLGVAWWYRGTGPGAGAGGAPPEGGSGPAQ